MLNHWVIALPPDDIRHCIKIGTFGRNSKGVMGKVQKGDRVACYATKECKVIALGEVTSDYYMDDRPIFKAEGAFPDRFDFSAKPLKAGHEIEIRSMVNDLTFITNKLYWSVFLRAGIAMIPEKDWKVIERRAR